MRTLAVFLVVPILAVLWWLGTKPLRHRMKDEAMHRGEVCRRLKLLMDED